MSKVKEFIKVHNQFEGTHCWENCPHEEVAFLKNPHRHMFHIYVTVEVSHSDREIEFFILQKDIERAWKQLYGSSLLMGDRYDLGSRSCEMIAQELHKVLSDKHDYKTIKSIEVSEDNENSGIVEWE